MEDGIKYLCLKKYKFLRERKRKIMQYFAYRYIHRAMQLNYYRSGPLCLHHLRRVLKDLKMSGKYIC